MRTETEAVEPLALDVVTVSKMLAISPSHVRNLVKDGTLPSTRLGKRILIPRAAVLAILEPPKERRR